MEDLADAHIQSMEKLQPGQAIYLNLGTGRGFSNREIIKTVEKVTGKKVPVVEGPRRPGDAVALYADPSRATVQAHLPVRQHDRRLSHDDLLAQPECQFDFAVNE